MALIWWIIRMVKPHIFQIKGKFSIKVGYSVIYYLMIGIFPLISFKDENESFLGE